MKIVFLGDIVGRSGRDVVFENLPRIKEYLKPDFIFVNGENAAAGFGITKKIAEEFFEAGIDVITLGNHVFDQKELVPYLSQTSKMIRPLNFPITTPGQGATIVTSQSGYKVLVINMIARLFMEMSDNPFFIINDFLKPYILGNSINAIIIDFHGEASSEKTSFANFLDGRVSVVVGTHSHVPTADYRILPKGTGFQTDLGMCGNYDSVIGMVKELAIAKFIHKAPTEKLKPQEGDGMLCGAFIHIDPASGLTTRIQPLRLGIGLDETPLERIIL
jgi:metallophosphoesterase (TIGR00282 family)